MRHGNGYKKLGRDTPHRRALLRNLATALVEHGGIQTTLPKAKSLRPVVEKLVTLGKRGDLHARRQVAHYLFDKKVASKLFNDLAPQYKDRNGGYLRILRLGKRFGDGAEMARIEFVEGPVTAKQKTATAKEA